MVLDLLRRLPKFNPERAQRKTFIARVVNHKVATIIEARKAGMRDYHLNQTYLDLNDGIVQLDDESMSLFNDCCQSL